MTEQDPWADEAAGWDDNPAVVAYADAAFASLEAAMPLARDMRVLDFGCGTGLLTERMAPHVSEVVAVDASPAMIEVLASKGLPNVTHAAVIWTPETIATDPLAEEPFDLIVWPSSWWPSYAWSSWRLFPRGFFPGRFLAGGFLGHGVVLRIEPVRVSRGRSDSYPCPRD